MKELRIRHLKRTGPVSADWVSVGPDGEILRVCNFAMTSQLGAQKGKTYTLVLSTRKPPVASQKRELTIDDLGVGTKVRVSIPNNVEKSEKWKVYFNPKMHKHQGCETFVKCLSGKTVVLEHAFYRDSTGDEIHWDWDPRWLELVDGGNVQTLSKDEMEDKKKQILDTHRCTCDEISFTKWGCRYSKTLGEQPCWP